MFVVKIFFLTDNDDDDDNSYYCYVVTRHSDLPALLIYQWKGFSLLIQK